MSGVTRGSALQACFVVCLALLGVAYGWATIGVRETPPPDPSTTQRPIEVRADGYASSQTCKACHPEQYSTWQASYHPLMTQVATPKSVRASFDNVEVIAEHGGPMRLERREGEFWAEFDDPDWDPRGLQTRRIRRPVVMVTGSHHQQVYWYSTGRDRVLGQLPAMYLIGEQRWLPRHSAFLRPPTEGPQSETGRWNTACRNCHATHSKDEAKTTAAEFGIACEACHGPSDEHQSVNRSPLRRYKLYLTGGRDSTTVHPVKLPARRSSEVCGQCHSVWWSFFDTVEERDRVLTSGHTYRPGNQLAATRFILQPRKQADSPWLKQILAAESQALQDYFWSDGMIRVSGREYNGLIDSPCYEHATDETRTLSCSSCHTMHKTMADPRPTAEWADTHQLSAGKQGNEACLQCHEPMRGSVPAHTRHQADSTGSACYNCHMPYTTYGLLRTLRSHQISSPTVTASLETGRPNACNLCHLDKTLAWTSEYLEKWYRTPPAALSTDQQTVAASLLWLLQGDAGQRALIAASMGWPPAQQASGTRWEAPYLALLLDDPYDAVRFIAGRSLRSLPGFDDFDTDFVAPQPERARDLARAVVRWRQEGAAGRTDAALLLDDAGSLTPDGWRRLFVRRNNGRVRLNE